MNLRRSSSSSRVDCMGDFRDDEQRPAKRIKHSPADEDAQPDPDLSSGSQSPDDAAAAAAAAADAAAYVASNLAGAGPWSAPRQHKGPWDWHGAPPVNGSVPMTMPDPAAVLVPDPAMLMSVPMNDPLSPPWNQYFDTPSAVDMSAAFPPEPQHFAPVLQELPQQPVRLQMTDMQQHLQPQPPLHPHIPPHFQTHPPVQPQHHPQPQPQRQPQPQPQQPPPPQPRVQQPPKPRQTKPARPATLIHEPSDQRRRKSRPKSLSSTPFADCIDSFGHSFTLKRFDRPSDGKVNGYIKFSWPRKDKKAAHREVEQITPVQREVVDVTDVDDLDAMLASEITHGGQVAFDSDGLVTRRGSASPSFNKLMVAALAASSSGSPVSTSSVFSAFTQPNTHRTSPAESFTSYLENSVSETPRFVPPNFGLNVVMDDMDKKLFKFYIYNWCPGRSILHGTNLWLKDFARMQESVGVLSAIQSLAGIYVHDYLPDEAVRKRINQRFAVAEARLGQLTHSKEKLDNKEQSELVTLAAILSMQDIVLTERRLKHPHSPRWLLGFEQGEKILQATDPGNRFYKQSNVQVDDLRASQAVIVGRAVILAQPMTSLVQPASFSTAEQAARFGFLLYGDEKELYKIHGGCGFSKRLLHIFSQVAFCAARMLKEPETPVVPRVINYLYKDLCEMHQWSTEFGDWEHVQQKSQPIEWIRSVDESYIVQNAQDMTDVSAEAWRLAAMVYMQCRALRLPRNHPDVLANLGDLAKSISIMPTSGTVFTAQAPLLPVFFLGLLGTVEEHVEVAHAWFQQVIYTPVRSSVPPLYEALERIQSWMPNEIPLPSPNMELPPTIAERQPWWELMVSKVLEKEEEVLCLT